MRRAPQPIIAAVHGAAAGGGFAIALAADVRIAGESARMNAAFIRLGLSACDVGVSYFLPRLVGASVASELLLTGDFIDADRALATGLVSRVVPDAELESAAREMAGRMLRNSPLALRLTKECLEVNVDAGQPRGGDRDRGPQPDPRLVARATSARASRRSSRSASRSSRIVSVRAFAQRLGARALRAVPERWIAPLAGAPTVIRGRTLDPHFALVTRASRSARAAHAHARGGARGHERVARAAPPRRCARSSASRSTACPAPSARWSRGCTRRHDLDGPRPLVLYFHQGGFVIGDLDWCEPFCSVLATRARCLVLSVDYRKGPEHRFPAAQDDAWAVYRYRARARGAASAAIRRAIGVGGDSAGGGLAAMIAQRARAERVRAPRFQLLIYPWLHRVRRQRRLSRFRRVPAAPARGHPVVPLPLSRTPTRARRRAPLARARERSLRARPRARLHGGLRHPVRRGRASTRSARGRRRAGRVPLLRVAAARLHELRGRRARRRARAGRDRARRRPRRSRRGAR